MSDSIRCEVAVIGSGPGGAVTAAMLCARGIDVVMLEEGPYRSLDSCLPFSIEEMRQKYRCGGLNPALGRPKIPLVEGCCVGGGSEINSGLYHRTPPDLLEFWRNRFGVRQLEEADLIPHFEACETALDVRLSPGPAHPASTKMKIGADRLGWKTLEVPRWLKYGDASTSLANGRTSKRRSMTETFVPSAQAAGCRLMAEVRAHRLERAGAHWRIKAREKSRLLNIDAEAVFVCGGALETPALLRRSGIKKNIGNTLALAPMIKVAAVFEDQVNCDHAEVPAQQIKEFSPAITMGCSISSLPYLALATTDYPDMSVHLTRIWRRMSVYYASITGPNTGVVRNVPFSPAPLVRYALTPEHLRTLATGLRHLCRALFAAGAVELYPGIAGTAVLRNEDDLIRIPAELPRDRISLTTVHLFSSCPMGEATDLTAVDSFGQVHGHKNLFVNDASLLCTAPGVNPQGSIMALARRNAQHFSRNMP